jgi:hypothetical protein
MQTPTDTDVDSFLDSADVEVVEIDGDAFVAGMLVGLLSAIDDAPGAPRGSPQMGLVPFGMGPTEHVGHTLLSNGACFEAHGPARAVDALYTQAFGGLANAPPALAGPCPGSADANGLGAFVQVFAPQSGSSATL